MPEFNRINPPFPTRRLGDKRLRLVEVGGHLILGQIGFFAGPISIVLETPDTPSRTEKRHPDVTSQIGAAFSASWISI